MPGMSKALPRMTLAVLRPIPGRATSSSSVCGSTPSCFSTTAAPEPDQRRRLVAVEARGVDQLLQLGAVRRGVVGRRPVAGEQLRGDLVDPHVRGLRRQDGRHGQLVRSGEVELAVRVRMRLGELAQHAPDPARPAQCGLAGGDPPGQPGGGGAGGETARGAHTREGTCAHRQPARVHAYGRSTAPSECRSPSAVCARRPAARVTDPYRHGAGRPPVPRAAPRCGIIDGV